jgi:hypothetical protein
VDGVYANPGSAHVPAVVFAVRYRISSLRRSDRVSGTLGGGSARVDDHFAGRAVRKRR